jgi:hypothetical protein
LRNRLSERNALPAKVLAGYRWVEVPHEFASLSISECHNLLLARLLAQAWEAALTREFPGQLWRTEVLPPSATGGAVGVCFENAPQQRTAADGRPEAGDRS